MTLHQPETGLAAQIELEYGIIDATRSAWFKDTLKAVNDTSEADTAYGKGLVRTAIADTVIAVKERIAAVLNGKPHRGRPGVAVPILRTLDPEVASLIALRAAFDGVSKPRDVQAVSVDCGHRLEDQMKLEAFKKQHPTLFNLTSKRLQRMEVVDRKRRRTVMRLMTGRAGTAWTPWTKQQHMAIGNILMECVKKGTGLIDFSFETQCSRGKVTKHHAFVPTPKTLGFMQAMQDNLSLLHPRFVPTIIRPKRWTNPHNGGYWSGLLPLSLVKKSVGKILTEMGNRDMREVYSALNRMQDTAWKINMPVLDVFADVLHNGRSIGGLPPLEDAPVPPRPADIDTNEMAKREWKAWAAKIYTANKKEGSKRIQVTRVKDIAVKFSQYPAIYFPHQLDFRGRAYAVPTFLNPQGPDYAKALLTFAKGKPINNGVAAGWLAIHGANLYGIDKVSLDERIGWVQGQEAAIIATAADPMSHQGFWCSADKPWQFLAFCFEYAAFLTEGYGFVSHLPVALDGSCNGLQHYSAALRDPVGGAATNLIPADKPSDIYAEVARECAATVIPLVTPGADTGSPEWFAAKWMEFGIDRKITKRSVMTLPYGSTVFSCREFIEEALRAKVSSGKANVFAWRKRVDKEDGTVEWRDSDGIFDASLFLQGHLWKAIGRVVKAAVDGMGWLRKCAALACAEGLPVIWELPDGFLVAQSYNAFKGKRIKTMLEGELVYFMNHERTTTLDKRRMANGIAPNWVHSLDAAALRSFVNLAFDNGVESFGLVHDSYATVAADAEMMSICIRESFAQLYEDNDVLAQFRTSIERMLSDESRMILPPVPDKGALAISTVRSSEFFFA